MLPGKADPGAASAAAKWCAVNIYPVSGCDSDAGKDDVSVKISDISDALNLPRPGVTRTVKEMEEKGFLQKIASPDDGRVTYITITEAGKELHQKFDAQYFDMLAPYMDEISEEDAQNMIRTIEKFYQIMRERREYDGSR